MIEPEYKRTFSIDDFRGHFMWSKALSRELGGSIYHACHKDEMEDILDSGFLELRSKWKIRLLSHGTVQVPGIWFGLNYFRRGNYYGPLVVGLPVDYLNGMSFMVFRRDGNGRKRFYFVQYESRIPIYSVKGNLWRKVKPRAYFDKNGDQVHMKDNAIYEFVLTEPVLVRDAIFTGVDHPHCISQKCTGSSRSRSRDIMSELALKHVRKEIEMHDIVKDAVKRFPDITGASLEIQFS